MAILTRRNIGIFLFCAGILLCTSGTAFSRGARLTDISITNSQNDLLLYMKVSGAFEGKIEKAIISGVPTTFSFFITLEEVRRFWTDRTVSEVALTHTIKYNNLKKEFLIRRSWDQDRVISVRSIEEARKLMTEIDGFRLAPLDRLEKGARYQISAKAKLSKITLPFYLHYIMLMASLWDFETDWHTVTFTY